MLAEIPQPPTISLKNSEYSALVEKFPFYSSLSKLAKIRLFDVVTLKALSEMDNINYQVLVSSLDFIYVISGRIDLQPYGEGSRIISLTDGQCLDPQRLRQSGIKKIELLEVKQICKVLVVDSNEYQAFVDPDSCYVDKISGFVIESIPKFSQYRIRKHAEVVSLFRMKRYNTGNIILAESVPNEYVHLIFQGECVLSVKQNKYLNEALFKQSNCEDYGGCQGIVPRGFLSSTALSAQIGVLSPGSWVGEETIIFKEPLNYSVTAKGPVITLAVKTTHLGGLPVDILKEMAKKTKVKVLWITKRLQKLSETTADVLNDDTSNRIYQKCITQISHRFPQATPYAIQNLRKLVLKNEPKVGPATFHKLGYLHVEKRGYSVRNSG